MHARRVFPRGLPTPTHLHHFLPAPLLIPNVSLPPPFPLVIAPFCDQLGDPTSRTPHSMPRQYFLPPKVQICQWRRPTPSLCGENARRGDGLTHALTRSTSFVRAGASGQITPNSRGSPPGTFPQAPPSTLPSIAVWVRLERRPISPPWMLLSVTRQPNGRKNTPTKTRFPISRSDSTPRYHWQRVPHSLRNDSAKRTTGGFHIAQYQSSSLRCHPRPLGLIRELGGFQSPV
ncbi:hypothetical protein B0H16DRAFT_1536584 [Mycena metata]|uniref:Uncharacterized protein n=1 Tax=Mycena metata TaxID=1033252 RepID=A0AAD7NEX2_9AGAR|nr:hypothetical protein B0H16DRAFT_1536584 [Mycena metata]